MSNLAPANPLPARRSCLSVPASSPDKLAKARERGADEVVIDLEDARRPCVNSLTGPARV
jgi:hypothetical protein